MEYDLLSLDWDKVSLLHSEHLSAETLYVEQLHRWGLQHGRAWGLVYMRDGDLNVSGGIDNFEVSLRYCKAITLGGYLIDIDPLQPPIRASRSNDAYRDSAVPIYIGVGVKKEGANAGSSQTGALLDRPTLRWNYKLATEKDDANRSWFQIGRMRKSGVFVLDLEFVPQCVHLRSHPVLFRLAAEIAKEATAALRNVERASKQTVERLANRVGTDYLAMLASAVATLAPATVLLDWDIHPRAHLERLIAVLHGCQVLVPLLPVENATWETAKIKVADALDCVKSNAPDGYPSSFSLLKPSQEGAAFSGDLVPSSSYNGAATEAEQDRPDRYWWTAFEKARLAFASIAVVLGELSPRPGLPRQVEPPGGTVVERKTEVFRPKY